MQEEVLYYNISMSEYLNNIFKKYPDRIDLDFQKAVVNTKKEVLGLKFSDIKQIAKEIYNTNNISILDSFTFETHEETVIYFILLIYYYKENSLPKILEKIDEIDTWVVTDTIVPCSQYVKKDLDKYYPEFIRMLSSDKVFEARLGLVFLQRFYKQSKYVDEIIKECLSHNYKEYYLIMGEAWLLCEFCIFNNHLIKDVVSKLDGDLKKYTIRKLLDSYRISEADKEYLKSIRWT